MTPYSAVFVPEHPESSTELSLMSLSPLINGIGSDWAQYSASGFLEVNPHPFWHWYREKQRLRRLLLLSKKTSNRSEAASPSSTFKSFDLSGPSSGEIKLGGVEEQKNIIETSQPRVFQLDEAFIGLWSDSLLDPISADWPTLIICKFKSSLVAEHIQVNKPWRATVGRLGEPRGCITTKMLMIINEKRSKNKVQVVQLISIIPSKTKTPAFRM